MVTRLARGVLALSLRSLRRPLGRPVIAERFAAPAELAAIRLPALPLDPERGPVSFLLLDQRTGESRAARLERIQPGADLSFGFPAFTNSRGAFFFLFAFQPAGQTSGVPGALQRRLAVAGLGRRPPIRLACNEELPGFHALALPPHPPRAMHRLGREAVEEASALPVAGAIETWWQEGGGFSIQGWLHAYERRVVSAAAIGRGRAPQIARLTARPDLVARFPMLPGPEPVAGFSLFVRGCAGEAIGFTIATEDGPASLLLPLPGLAGPPATTLAHEGALRDQGFVRFAGEVNARRLEVMEIGARLVGGRSEAQRERFPKARRYVGMDVHRDPTVDVVGDVHELSRLVGRASFDAIFSGAVLEHLAMPWVVAAEINRALRLGGITYHMTPQAWPVHEEPNDFWRFTDEALKLLFGEPFGFEVLSAGMADRVRLYPLDKEKGDLGLPLGYGYASSWVLARKVREIDVAAGPVGLPASLAALGRRYPRPG